MHIHTPEIQATLRTMYSHRLLRLRRSKVWTQKRDVIDKNEILSHIFASPDWRVFRAKTFYCLNKKVDSQQHVISRAPTSNSLIQKKTRHCGGGKETHLPGIKIPAGQGRALHFYLKIGSTFSIPLDAREGQASAPVTWKKPSPSTQRRKARGEHSFLKLKAFLLQYDENSRS